MFGFMAEICIVPFLLMAFTFLLLKIKIENESVSSKAFRSKSEHSIYASLGSFYIEQSDDLNQVFQC